MPVEKVSSEGAPTSAGKVDEIRRAREADVAAALDRAAEEKIEENQREDGRGERLDVEA